MSDSPVSQVAQRIDTALAGLAEVAGAGTGDGDLLTLLTLCEAAARRVDQLLVGVLAEVERRGVFADRGYRSSAAALGDLLGCDRAEARRLSAAPLVRPRIGLDGTPLPPRLAATATVFEAGALADACGYVLQHADVRAACGKRPVLTVTIRLDDLEKPLPTGDARFRRSVDPRCPAHGGLRRRRHPDRARRPRPPTRRRARHQGRPRGPAAGRNTRWRT